MVELNQNTKYVTGVDAIRARKCVLEQFEIVLVFRRLCFSLLNVGCELPIVASQKLLFNDLYSMCMNKLSTILHNERFCEGNQEV